jgi:hypothetical protein
MDADGSGKVDFDEFERSGVLTWRASHRPGVGGPDLGCDRAPRGRCAYPRAVLLPRPVVFEKWYLVSGFHGLSGQLRHVGKPFKCPTAASQSTGMHRGAQPKSEWASRAALCPDILAQSQAPVWFIYLVITTRPCRGSWAPVTIDRFRHLPPNLLGA